MEHPLYLMGIAWFWTGAGNLFGECYQTFYWVYFYPSEQFIGFLYHLAQTLQIGRFIQMMFKENCDAE
ncbi:MAG: hypothetical protein M1119_07315 [Firmicutes bacterium]|nr:hypothetical protein [Bacillota bacterium]